MTRNQLKSNTAKMTKREERILSEAKVLPHLETALVEVLTR